MSVINFPPTVVRNREIRRLPVDREAMAASLARPSAWAKLRLGMDLHPKQAAVLDDLFSRPKQRVAWFCSNEVGKTSRVATAAVLYALEIRKARVQVTSGSNRQLKEQLVPSLKRQAWRFPQWSFLAGSIQFGGINQALFYAARDQGTFQGFHEESEADGDPIPQLIICDESAAVPDEILASAEDRCNPTWLLFMGSPLSPTGMFYHMQRERAAFYSQHRLNKLECTKPRGGWHEPEDVARTISKNCGLTMDQARDIVRAGVHGGLVTDPMTLSSVFGEFGTYVEYALLTLTEFEKCLDNPPPFEPGERHAFCDFAAGRAKNVLAVRHGNKVWIEKAWREPNEMTAVGEFVRLFRRLQEEIGLQADEIDGDGDGLGGPMVRRIQELGWPINDFHGGAAPRFVDSYKDAWSEAWGEGAKALKGCDLIMPRDPEFQSQALGRKIKPHSSGKMKLETKDEMRVRGMPSPDEADAIFGVVLPPAALRSFAAGQRPKGWQEVISDYESGRGRERVEVIPGADC